MYVKGLSIAKATIVGKSAITLFRYLISEKKEENFREPLVLVDLISRLFPAMRKSNAVLEGWGLHYFSELMFCYGYHKLWKTNRVNPGVVSGNLLGASSGAAGILVWEPVFKSHPNSPAKNLNNYFGHLMLAFVVFGTFSGLTYQSKASKVHFVEEILLKKNWSNP